MNKFLDKIYDLDDEESIIEIVNKITSLLMNKRFNSCDIIFKNIDVEKLSSIKIRTLPAVTNDFKQALCRRKEFYDKAYNKLKKEDWQDYIKGLE